MAIYDMYNSDSQKDLEAGAEAGEMLNRISLQQKITAASSSKDRVFSLVCIRLFFLMLLMADILWGVYSLLRLVVFLLFSFVAFFKKDIWTKALSKSWLSFKRSLVCGLALFVSLFSTGFGIMIACTYFVMYDKDGIEEVVPSSLQSHFKEFFQGSN